MRHIQKTTVPPFFITHTNSLTDWVDYHSSHKRELKKHILGNEQFSLCCYCESLILEDLSNSHLEHIYPKCIDNDKTFDYQNILVSCNGKHFNEITNQVPEHCGHKKSNFFNESLFLNPTIITDFKSYFKYNKDRGLISEFTNSDNKAMYTILLLDLNNQVLVQARLIAKKNIIKLLNGKTVEECKSILMKILDNKSLQFHSFLNYCFRD